MIAAKFSLCPVDILESVQCTQKMFTILYDNKLIKCIISKQNILCY